MSIQEKLIQGCLELIRCAEIKGELIIRISPLDLENLQQKFAERRLILPSLSFGDVHISCLSTPAGLATLDVDSSQVPGEAVIYDKRDDGLPLLKERAVTVLLTDPTPDISLETYTREFLQQAGKVNVNPLASYRDAAMGIDFDTKIFDEVVRKAYQAELALIETMLRHYHGVAARLHQFVDRDGYCEIVDIAGNVLASVERKQVGLKIHWEAKHHWRSDDGTEERQSKSQVGS